MYDFSTDKSNSHEMWYYMLLHNPPASCHTYRSTGRLFLQLARSFAITIISLIPTLRMSINVKVPVSLEYV